MSGVAALPPPRRPVLQGAYFRGFPAFVLAAYLQRQGFTGWLHGLVNVHPEQRAELALALAELERAAEQYRDWRASESGPAVHDSAAEDDAAAAAESVHEISTDEAAVMLGVSPNRVRQLCRAGHLQARQVGKTWLVDAASVRLREVA